MTLLALVLWRTATPYKPYFESAQFVHFLLGPATVALAAPLCGYLSRIGRSVIPMLYALLAGSTTAILNALGIAYALGVRSEMLLSIAP